MPTNDTPSELWRLPRVIAVTGLSRSMVYRLISAGTFPKPVGLGGTAARAWRSDEVAAWVDQQTTIERTES